MASKQKHISLAGLHYLMSFYSHYTGSRKCKLKCAEMYNSTHPIPPVEFLQLPHSVPHTNHMGDVN